MNELIRNIEKVHTTPLGEKRIGANLQVKEEDAVSFCVKLIKSPSAQFERKGKNWYVTDGEIIVTVNASSYTLITAKKKKI